MRLVGIGLLLVVACDSSKEGKQDAARLDSDQALGGSQKPPCSTGCSSFAPQGVVVVCLFGHCDLEPEGPCTPGSCRPGWACVSNLKSYCPNCTRASGCLPPPVCDGVTPRESCSYTPRTEDGGGPSSSNPTDGGALGSGGDAPLNHEVVKAEGAPVK